jgi:hypothetical protein
MARTSILSKLFFALLAAQAVAAFAPRQAARPALVALEASSKPFGERFTQIVTTAAAVLATSPLMALAEEIDDYEYGKVDAPIGIAWAAGVLVIATAGVPLLLSGGEDEFNKMKDRDADNWGSGKGDPLNKNRKR